MILEFAMPLDATQFQTGALQVSVSAAGSVPTEFVTVGTFVETQSNKGLRDFAIAFGVLAGLFLCWRILVYCRVQLNKSSDAHLFEETFDETHAPLYRL
ncbi:MAG: hypothetical protein MHM6MM_004482 [Cercozoa sp. M6MM]